MVNHSLFLPLYIFLPLSLSLSLFLSLSLTPPPPFSLFYCQRVLTWQRCACQTYVVDSDSYRLTAEVRD